jgi:hypothetical protein
MYDPNLIVKFMSDDKNTQINKALGALGTLERATEFQTFLLLASFAVALNTTLTLTHQTNLTGFSWQYAKDNFPIGQGLVFLAVFALYMSCIVGTLRYVVELFVGPLVTSYIRSSRPEPRRTRDRPSNMVHVSDLLEAARDEAEGDAYLAMHNDHLDKRREEEAAAQRAASLSFGLLLLLAIEAMQLGNASLSISFIHFLNSVFPRLGAFIGGLVVLILLILWLSRFIEDDSYRDWVTCPKLYIKLEREQQKKEQEQVAALHRNTSF